jgi:hypothetical protein
LDRYKNPRQYLCSLCSSQVAWKADPIQLSREDCELLHN